jgi:putative ABC transport system permease protein
MVAGFYPSVVLSSFRPRTMLKGGGGLQSGFVFRRALVVLQFAISIGLIAASAIVFQQWNFMRNKSLGLNKEMAIAVPLQTMDRKQLDAFRNELLTNTAVKSAGYSNMRLPGWIGNSTSYRAQDVESDEEVNKSMKIVRIDYDFFSTLETTLVAGRDFSRSFPADSVSSLIINESAVAQLKWKDPVGKWLELDGRKFNVVGIVKDFHFESLHREIPPTIFIFSSQDFNWAYVRLAPQGVASALGHVQKTYARFVTNRDFTYSFLNDDIEKQYEGEQKFAQVFTLFTVLAIIIACLGTFGLISFTAERRTKEIGIRKVLGASAAHVSFMLIREFIILLAVASVIAWPLSWYFLNGWVEGFIYRTTIGAGPFVLATVLAALIVVLTTGVKAMKAALANPVDALRTE